jgi:predicted aspartyl protease
MWRYDHKDFPSAPKLDVQFLVPGLRARSISLRAKLDTGASTTVIPERYVNWLILPPHETSRAFGYDGFYRLRPTYRIDLVLNGFELRWIRCSAADRDDILLERSVLNLFVITLDGPRLTFDMQQS